MSHHDDLLRLAEELVDSSGPGRPRQANLKKAVSAAYYALFHLLCREAAARLVSGPGREGLRQALGRAFVHAEMKTVAKAFGSGALPAPLRHAMSGANPGPALRRLANRFVVLQEKRHAADYDLASRFSRAEVRALVVDARMAFSDWNAIRKTLEADAFLVALLAQRRMQG